ncbi:kinase-like domain-containing protein [Chytridium lagenaria]|nr:kinase-like domain-containing protein [Chytridium lagenaria]
MLSVGCWRSRYCLTSFISHGYSRRSESIATSISPAIRTSYRREVAILRSTSTHPTIIRLLDAWESRTEVYQVFNVCTGGDLSTGLPGPLKEDLGVAMMGVLSDAVRFVHELGVLHRDIRPANVFLRRAVTGGETREEVMDIPLWRIWDCDL